MSVIYLQPIGDLLRSDVIKYHSPDGTSELYSATGDVEEILYLIGYQLGRLAKALGALPTESDGLRTDTMDGILDPNETIAVAGDELRQAAALTEQAAGHAHAALNKTARLYVESAG